MAKHDVFKYSSKLGSISWQFQDFDSEILERRVAKIISFDPRGDTSKTLVKRLLNSFKEKNIEYATYRFNASDFPTIHALENNGFVLVDGYINLEAEVLGHEDLPRNIRMCTENDIKALQGLASQSFSKTRFYNDPLIKKSQADKIYSEWIKNSILGTMADMVFVWEEGKNLLGFVTIKKNGNLALIALSKDVQGKGIGKLLVKAALSQFKKWKVKTSTIETQMTNIPALRTYQSCGYKTVDSHLTFRWADFYEN